MKRMTLLSFRGKIPKSFRDKDLVVFDLDGTLTRTKSTADSRMVQLLASLLAKKKVAVIGGGKYKQFQIQLLTRLHYPEELLLNLYLFPTTATSMYRYHKGWQRMYFLKFSRRERQKIIHTLHGVLKEIQYAPKKAYGKLIEDRGTQITLSTLGQDVVKILGAKGVRLKEEWFRKNKPLKFRIARLAQKRLPRFEVHAAGFTSIDVTRKGIDKAYGIRQIQKHLKIPIRKMLFIGDALFKGGNDYAARRTGVDCIAVRGPEDTKRIIRELLTEFKITP